MTDLITRTKDVVGGRARIDGTRIPVWQIILDLQHGETKEKLTHKRVRKITIEQINACEEYYAENKQEIDNDIVENLED